MSDVIAALEVSAQMLWESYAQGPNPDPGKQYKWRSLPGVRDVVAWCLPCDQRMGWALSIRREYPDTLNRTSLRNGKYQVFYRGRLVQVHKCAGCGQEVVK